MLGVSTGYIFSCFYFLLFNWLTFFTWRLILFLSVVCFWNQTTKSSVIRQKGESQNRSSKKTKHAKFSEKRTFLTSWYALLFCLITFEVSYYSEPCRTAKIAVINYFLKKLDLRCSTGFQIHNCNFSDTLSEINSFVGTTYIAKAGIKRQGLIDTFWQQYTDFGYIKLAASESDHS